MHFHTISHGLLISLAVYLASKGAMVDGVLLTGVAGFGEIGALTGR